MNKPLYLLFVGEGHRPDGGKWELTGVFKTMAEAQGAIDDEDHIFIVGSQLLELASINRTRGELSDSSWVVKAV